MKMTKLMSGLGAVALLVGLTATANAAPVRYSYEISGTILAGDEFGDANVWDLTAGDVITAFGQFTADLGTPGLETGSVDVLGSDGFIVIDLLDGQFLTENQAVGTITLDFLAGDINGVDYISSDFNSNFTFFDDFGLMLGEWDNLQLTVVPIPAAVWLFGSGLVALFGWSRRRA